MDKYEQQDLISALEQLIRTLEEVNHELLIEVRQSFSEFKKSVQPVTITDEAAKLHT